MAYEAHEWVCGETITADKMNNLGGGSGSTRMLQ